MEFLDEYESKPRFMFQSKNLPQSDQQPLQTSFFSLSSLHKPTLFISLSLSLLLLSLALIHFNFDPLKSILLWLSLSLLLGPFAPPSLTAGDIRVGLGPPLPPPADPIEIHEKPSRKSTKPNKRQSEDAEANSIDSSPQFDFPKQKSNRSSSIEAAPIEARAEEWGDGDDELLKKLMGRHPVGKPGRWEAIAEGFKGRHKVETVIARAKNIGDKKGGDLDSYAKFLKDRKPVQGNSDEEGKKESGGWSAAEDLALLNALKAFPKEVAMRWEKVAASVPGKTKAACVARMAELKKDFRSSKASASAN